MTNYSKLSDFLYIKQNALTKQFCEFCIEKFKKDPNLYPGKTGAGYLPEIKQSTDLCISNLDNWKDEDLIFYKSLHSGIDEYIQKYCNEFPWLRGREYTDHGYQIQETLPGGFYKWHTDYSVDENQSRIFTFIWYLNTVNDGGHTEFIDGTKIKPEIGKLMLFPATWNFFHQGTPPTKNKKYICTGWVYSDCSFTKTDT